MAKSKPERVPIPKETETEVLTLSRRRCVFCFGLENNLDVQAGQLAHVDDDPSNNKLENLAWLCLRHHDQYDSTTRQSKGLTPHELRVHRKRLYDSMIFKDKLPLLFGESYTITIPGVASFEWKITDESSLNGSLIEALIPAVPGESAYFLLVNGDWKNDSYANASGISIDSSCLTPKSIVWIGSHESAAMTITIRKAIGGTYFDASVLLHNDNTKSHKYVRRLIFYYHSNEKITSLAIGAMPTACPVGCTLTLRTK